VTSYNFAVDKNGKFVYMMQVGAIRKKTRKAPKEFALNAEPKPEDFVDVEMEGFGHSYYRCSGL